MFVRFSKVSIKKQTSIRTSREDTRCAAFRRTSHFQGILQICQVVSSLEKRSDNSRQFELNAIESRDDIQTIKVHCRWLKVRARIAFCFRHLPVNNIRENFSFFFSTFRIIFHFNHAGEIAYHARGNIFTSHLNHIQRVQ